MKNSILLFATFAAIFVVLFFNLFCNNSSSKNTSETYLNHDSTVKYVGMETCRSCHTSIYNSFIQTGMGQSFNVASKQKSAADFSKKHVVYDQFSDMYYHPFFNGDSMYIKEFRLEGKDTVYERTERVDFIVGSGQHTNSHMMNVNGYLYQLPLTWYAQKKQWDLPPGFENGKNVHFNRAIGFECMSCHNALPNYVSNSLNKFTTVPRGIDCERCHGPGELHVKEKLSGKIIDTATQIDYTIVNPKKLSWELQIDVCQRCHLQGNAVLKNGKTFSDFKPGMQLSNFIDVYMPKYKGREDEFIMASHAQRLQMSKCFIESSKSKTENKRSLTCITCHNPHVSVKVTGKQIFNDACIKCHNDKNVCKEKLAVRNLKSNDCVSCHMQKSGTIDIPHVTVTDHKIKIPVTQKTINDIKTFSGIYCINNQASDKETKCKAFLNYFEKFEGEKSVLDSAYFLLDALNGSELFQTKIHLSFLRNDFDGIVTVAKNINPNTINDPWTCYRVGQSFQNLQSNEVSEIWYRRALLLAPDNLDFNNKLGAILISQNKDDEGICIIENSIFKNPKQAEAFTNLGFAYLKKSNYDKALEYYNKALLLDPDFAQALLNKAGLCNILGQKSEAKKLLQQIVKRNPKNEDVRALLKSL